MSAPFDSGVGRPRASGSDRLVVLALAVFFAFGLFLFYAFAVVAAQSVVPDRPRLAITLAQVAGLLVPAAWFLALLPARGLALGAGTASRASLLRHAAPIVLTAATAFVVAHAGHVLYASWLSARGWAWVEWAEKLIEEGYGPLFETSGPFDVLVLVLVVSVVPAVCEELAFRRALQGLLASAFSGPLAIGLSAFVFAAFHVDPIGFPSRVFLGVSIGILYHRTGSLLVAAIAHGMHNSLSVGLVLLAPDPGDVSTPPELPPEAMVLLAATLAIAVLAWLVSVRAVPHLVPEPSAAPAADAPVEALHSTALGGDRARAAASGDGTGPGEDAADERGDGPAW